MGRSMARGYVVKIKNNYGILTTDAYKAEDEWIPFSIEKNMLVEKDGKEYIKYTYEVEFELTNSQGMRNKDIKEASVVKFVGKEWKYRERNIENNFYNVVRNRLDEYAFYYPNLSDEEFANWLEINDFQPRMLEYLSQGVFTPKKILLLKFQGDVSFEKKEERFSIQLLFAIDRIDIEFRKYILEWIVGVESSYKSYLAKLSISKEGKDISEKVLSKWMQKKPKINKLIKRARDKRKYRPISEEFDYLKNDCAVPLLDFMEQLELNELTELINLFYDEYSCLNEIPENLKKMKEYATFIGDLCTLRNAAAHGRAIIPDFMDPDYNGNWDFEFDNIEARSNVESWKLYELLKIRWEKLNLGYYSKQIINTLYGNPLRRAWSELNYIYFYIVKNIERKCFEVFENTAMWFLSKDIEWGNQIKKVKIFNLRLSDIGNTTMGVSPTPYDEIAQEAYAIWEIFE